MRKRFFCAREKRAVPFSWCHQPDRREGTDLHGPARTYTDAAVAANAGAIHGVLAVPAEPSGNTATDAGNHGMVARANQGHENPLLDPRPNEYPTRGELYNGDIRECKQITFTREVPLPAPITFPSSLPPHSSVLDHQAIREGSPSAFLPRPYPQRRGHPGIDWYKGRERVALSAWKHGYGIVSNGVVATFTPESWD